MERKHVLIAVLQVVVSCEIVMEIWTVKILSSFKDNIFINMIHTSFNNVLNKFISPIKILDY